MVVRRLVCVFASVVMMVAGFGCVTEHLAREIQPPGGCDQCHRGKIGSSWEVSLAPVPLGAEGGVVEAKDVILREVRRVPYHRTVPTKRLEVFAEGVPVRAVGGEERGIQCFVCHLSPEDPPHQGLRGQFPHPWGQRQP